MPPTPPQFGSPSYARLGRTRRPQNPYDTPQNVVTPSPAVPVTPMVDDSGDQGEVEHEEIDIEAEDDEGMEGGEDVEFGMDGHASEVEIEDEEGGIEEVPMEIDAPFDPAAMGLKEIGNLASWTVSTCKPGCGVEALRDEDTNLFWQSDGPQPHHLNIHFSRLVSIRSIRIYLDFRADESYTPTKITLLAGTGYHDLIPFSSLEFEKPTGWIDVPLNHVGGGDDGRTLRAFLVQVKIVENHQNGKDTHVRGLKVFARDERGRGAIELLPESTEWKSKAVVKADSPTAERAWLVEPDWMGDAELR